MQRIGAASRSLMSAMSLTLCFILCVALAACGDLPRPFQPAEKGTQAWSGPGDVAWGSILVPPIEGLPAERSAVLVDQVVEALQARDLPASAHAGGRGSIVLAGQIALVTGVLRWSLTTPDGETALRFEEPGLDALSSGTTAADLAPIAARAAGRVAALLKPPSTQDPNRPPRAPVVVEAVRGAPGEGGIALARAMRHSLAHIGIRVVDDSDKGALAIQGWVRVAQDDTTANDAAVTIAWDVLHPEGARLGTITQGNRVDANQLTGTWGVLPRLIARAGAPGIAQLLDRPDVRRIAATPRRKALAAPTSRSPIEAPLTLSITVSAKRPSVLVEAPIAVSVTVR